MSPSASKYRISEKRSGRFVVRLKGGKIINGEEKLAALVEAKKVPDSRAKKKPEPEAPAAEAAPEGDAAGGDEAPAES